MTGISLERRSTPDRLRYLAGKLREGEDRWVNAVALSLDAIADEMDAQDDADCGASGSAPGHG